MPTVTANPSVTVRPATSDDAPRARLHAAPVVRYMPNLALALPPGRTAGSSVPATTLGLLALMIRVFRRTAPQAARGFTSRH